LFYAKTSQNWATFRFDNLTRSSISLKNKDFWRFMGRNA